MKRNFSEPLQAVATWLDAQKDFKKIPSISAGIVLGQDLIWSGGFGYSNLSLKIKSTDSTIYSICSISKIFTSIAIMQLRDQRKLDLNDPISLHLPWFNIEQVYANSAPVTIKSLLTHSSGLPKDSDFPYFTNSNCPFPDQSQLREKLSQQKTLYPTSTFFHYSNLGMSLLGEIISKNSSLTYEKYIYDNIIHPLKLTDTHPQFPESYQTGRLATGYSIESRAGIRKELPFVQANSLAPAAGFYSTVKDLAKFATWQFNTLEGKDDSILNKNTLKEMQRVHWKDSDGKTVWGLGFGIEKLHEETFVYHSGCCPGYLSQFVVFPKKKWAFIVLVNSLGVDTFQYVKGMYNILSSHIQEKTEKNSLELNLEDYCGIYHYFSVGERLVVPWKGKLATFCLQSPNQYKPEMLMRHDKGDIFKRIREDGNLAEEIKFERNEKGKVIRLWQHYQYAEKLT